MYSTIFYLFSIPKMMCGLNYSILIFFIFQLFVNKDRESIGQQLNKTTIISFSTYPIESKKNINCDIIFLYSKVYYL